MIYDSENTIKNIIEKIKEYDNITSKFKVNSIIYQLSQTTSEHIWGKIISCKNRPVGKEYKRV